MHNFIFSNPSKMPGNTLRYVPAAFIDIQTILTLHISFSIREATEFTSGEIFRGVEGPRFFLPSDKRGLDFFTLGQGGLQFFHARSGGPTFLHHVFLKMHKITFFLHFKRFQSEYPLTCTSSFFILKPALHFLSKGVRIR